MERGKYRTKQREEMTAFFRGHPDRAYSARELIDSGELDMGEATVYRVLAALSAEGVLKKVVPEEGKTTRYRLHEGERNEAKFLLKCTRCGGTMTACCDFVSELEHHMSDDHDFYVSPESTVFYGLCGECRHKTDHSK